MINYYNMQSVAQYVDECSKHADIDKVEVKVVGMDIDIEITGISHDSDEHYERTFTLTGIA